MGMFGARFAVFVRRARVLPSTSMMLNSISCSFFNFKKINVELIDEENFNRRFNLEHLQSPKLWYRYCLFMAAAANIFKRVCFQNVHL